MADGIIAVVDRQHFAALADDKVGAGVGIARAVEPGQNLVYVVFFGRGELVFEARLYFADAFDIVPERGN